MGSLIDNFESSFTDCIHSFSKQESTIDVDKDEIKLEVEQTTMKFIDLARQMETFFLQKRFTLATSRPELLLKEENADLRLEIARKDELIKKHLQKIAKWKEYLADTPAGAARPAMAQEPHVPPPQQPGLPDSPVPLMPGQRRPPPQHMQQQMAQGNNPVPMFMPRPGFPHQGQMGGPAMQGPMGGNPLAFLEKTTNNIDMGPSAPR